MSVADLVVLGARWRPLTTPGVGEPRTPWVDWTELEDAERAAVTATFRGVFNRPPCAAYLGVRTEDGQIVY